jgi:mono/diheme cytochrome c family protein
MRTAIASLLIAVLAVLFGAGALIYGGVYDVAATTPHWPAARAILETARLRSIKAHASDIKTPAGLDDPTKLVIGVEHYAAHCAICHGAPGVPRGDIGRGLYRPRPLSAAGSGQSRVILQSRRALLDPQARDQNGRDAGLERSQR